ncbi:MAG: hypothetical protein H0X73_13810 [Chthoniobacterales bacterium]|nr:hypothetical protein [Chthoniobacterales bacterium]
MNKSTFNPFRRREQSVSLGAIQNITRGVKTRRLAALAALATILASSATVAFATPPVGIVSATVFATASFTDLTNVRFGIKDGVDCGREIVYARNAQDTVMQQIIIAPGGNSGWHLHPGPVVVLVKAGQLSYFSGDDPTCTARIYPAGQAFVEGGRGHVAFARNDGNTNLELWVTYFDVPPGGLFRIDAPAPGNCSF